jgi:cytochrome c-type biogenesis protein CcmH
MSASRRLSAVVLLAAVVVAAAGFAVVAARSSGEPRTLQERTLAVASTLRCPVCQNLSAADSPSGIAEEMRRTIEADLRAGKTPDQIRDEFVQAYGTWILLAPRKRGLDLVARVLPVLLVVGAMVGAWLTIRRWTSTASNGGLVPGAPELSAEDRSMLERALAEAKDDPT